MTVTMSQHEINNELIDIASLTRQDAFAPYTEFRVGAALFAEGELYKGVNVEVSGRQTSIHAEAMAFFNAVMDGKHDFHTIAISTSGNRGVAPCSLCLHTMKQFADDLTIVSRKDGGYNQWRLSELFHEDVYTPQTRGPVEDRKDAV